MYNVLDNLIYWHLWVFILLGITYCFEEWDKPSSWEFNMLLWPLSGIIPLVGEVVLLMTLWAYLKTLGQYLKELYTKFTSPNP